MKKSVLIIILSLNLFAQFSGGSGTEVDPYQVATASDLANIENYSDKYFIQSADIDLSSFDAGDGKGWKPLYNGSNSFVGTYDGNGHTIDGLTINRPAENNCGLFFITQDATLLNINLTNVNISGNEWVGALTAFDNSGNIENCFVSGTVNGDSTVGGLIGYMKGTTVVASSSSANVQANYRGGSFLGVTFASAIENSRIDSCYSTGNVICDSAAGGFAGEIKGDDSFKSIVSNCYSRGTVSGEDVVGGFVGRLERANIINCYSTGLTTGTLSNYGGLIGQSQMSSLITSCFWDKETSGQSSSDGGTGKITSEMKSASTFIDAGWDANIWNIGDGINDGYPYLDWQNPSGTSLNGTSSNNSHSLYFDGVNDYVTLGNGGAAISSLTNQIALEAWIKTNSSTTTDLGTANPIIAQRMRTPSIGGSFMLYFYGYENRDVIAFSINDATLSSPFNAISEDEWVHVAGVYDGSDLIIYINGENVASQTYSENIVHNGINIHIGSIPDQDNRYKFDGNIDEVRIWGRGLSQAEIQNKMNTILDPALENGLITYLRFEEGSGETTLSETPATSDYIGGGSLMEGTVWSSDTKALDTDHEIIITSPNGGENWGAGTEQNITWISSNVSTIKIEVSGDDGNTWIEQATNVDASSGEYTWNVPINSSEQTLIRLTDESDNTISDVSDDTFTVLNSSLFFNGIDNYVNITNNPLLNITEEITISAYIKIIEANAQQDVLVMIGNRGESNGTGYIFSYDYVNNLLNFGYFGPFGVSASVDLLNNTWYKVAVTYDKINVKFYVDDLLIETIPQTASGSAATIDLTIGCWNDRYSGKGFYFSGYIDELKVYNRALAQSELATFTKRSSVIQYDANLIAYYPMNEGNGTTVSDYSGNNISATVVGATFSGDAPSPEPLPVELVIFTGELSGEKIGLYWETATEVNNYGFNVERTLDHQVWESLGFVQGHGTTNSPKSYSFTDNNLPNVESVDYRLKQIDNDGTFAYSKTITVDLTSITSVEVDEIPNTYSLEQNYPNPFNPTTTIKFGLPEVAAVHLSVYNILGEQVIEIVNQELEAGYHQYKLDASHFSSGVYIYQIKAGEFIDTKKLILLK